jgi:hypothetical protein
MGRRQSTNAGTTNAVSLHIFTAWLRCASDGHQPEWHRSHSLNDPETPNHSGTTWTNEWTFSTDTALILHIDKYRMSFCWVVNEVADKWASKCRPAGPRRLREVTLAAIGVGKGSVPWQVVLTSTESVKASRTRKNHRRLRVTHYDPPAWSVSRSSPAPHPSNLAPQKHSSCALKN